MKEKRLVRFQKWMARGSLIAGACFVLFFSFSLMEESIPDKIWIEKGEEENFDLLSSFFRVSLSLTLAILLRLILPRFLLILFA